MDNIKVKLANPYIENFDAENMGYSNEIVTFPSKPIKIEAILPSAAYAQKCALYAVTCEDGKVYPFGVVFLLAQMNEVNGFYTKLFNEQEGAGEIPVGFTKIAESILRKDAVDQINLNRYGSSLSRSAVSLNEQFGRGEDVSIDYSYQLSWSDVMDVATIDSPTFFNVFLDPSKNDLTTPNEKYEGLSNWSGTSYNAFWCVIQGEGQGSIAEAADAAKESAEECIEAQRQSS